MHKTLAEQVLGYVDSLMNGWCFHKNNTVFPLRFKMESGDIKEVILEERSDVNTVYKSTSNSLYSGWRLSEPMTGNLEMCIEGNWTPVFSLKRPWNKKPTICFATMCKNEEDCIKETLESVYKYIDYWVVHDTGSTDRTCDIVKEFFSSKNIPGELFIDTWEGFDVNKTKLFERCYKKSDYILHLDADDLLFGDFEFTDKDVGYLKYLVTTRRYAAQYKTSMIFDNNTRWKFIGVAHNIIRNLDNPLKLLFNKDLSHRNFYYESRDLGKRSTDPEKFLKDAIKLKDQFHRTLIDDPDNINSRSVFYTAKSYFDQGMILEAAQYFSLYTKLKDTWEEEVFYSNLTLIECFYKLKLSKEKIIDQGKKAIDIYRDRAEPYFKLGIYANQASLYELGYEYLKMAKSKSYSNVIKKYVLFVNIKSYGKYVNYPLSISCLNTKRYNECITLINEIIDDKDFNNIRNILVKNLEICKKSLQ